MKYRSAFCYLSEVLIVVVGHHHVSEEGSKNLDQTVILFQKINSQTLREMLANAPAPKAAIPIPFIPISLAVEELAGSFI